MNIAYVTDKTFEKNNFSKDSLEKGEYEKCVFSQCDFSKANLSDFKFIDCEFKSCDLSLATIHGTAFRDVKFKDCKMLGVRFDHCNPFGLAFTFDNCILNHSSFSRIKIKKTIVKSLKWTSVHVISRASSSIDAILTELHLTTRC